MPPQSLALAAAAAAGALAATLLARRRRRTPAPSRVRHMVLVQLKPGTPSDAVDAMLAALRRLPARIPTILRIEVGRQVASLDDGRNASIGGLVEFASEDDYRAYAKDPAHVAVIKDYILPHMAEGGRARCRLPLMTGRRRPGRGRRARGMDGGASRSRCVLIRRGWPSTSGATSASGPRCRRRWCGTAGTTTRCSAVPTGVLLAFLKVTPSSEVALRRMAREAVNER